MNPAPRVLAAAGGRILGVFRPVAARPAAIALLVAAVLALGLLNQWKQVRAFGLGYHDYGLIRGMILNDAAGDPVTMRPPDRDASHLATHFHPVLVALAWVQRLVPYEDLYGAVTAAGWAALIVGFGWLVRDAAAAGLGTRRGGAGRHAPAALGLLAGLVLLVNSHARRVLFAGHYEHLQAVGMLVAALAWLRSAPRVYVAGMIAACLVREDAALYAGCLSAGLALETRDRAMRRTAMIVAIGAFVWFAAAWFIWMPAWRTAGVVHDSGDLLMMRWGRGRTLGAVAGALLSHPWDIATALGRASVRILVWGFAMLPLFAPRLFAIACLPPILMLALSPDPDYHRFRYYNASMCLGPLAVAAALGVRRLTAWSPRGLAAGAGTAALLLAARLVLGGFDRTPPHLQPDLWSLGMTPAGKPFPVTPEARAARVALRRIDTAGADIAGGPNAIVHLRHDRRLRLFADWETRRPALVVFADPFDFPVALYWIGVPSRTGLADRMRASGYRRTPAAAGLEVWARRDISAAAAGRLLGGATDR